MNLVTGHKQMLNEEGHRLTFNTSDQTFVQWHFAPSPALINAIWLFAWVPIHKILDTNIDMYRH